MIAWRERDLGANGTKVSRDVWLPLPAGWRVFTGVMARCFRPWNIHHFWRMDRYRNGSRSRCFNRQQCWFHPPKRLILRRSGASFDAGRSIIAARDRDCELITRVKVRLPRFHGILVPTAAVGFAVDIVIRVAQRTSSLRAKSMPSSPVRPVYRNSAPRTSAT